MDPRKDRFQNIRKSMRDMKLLSKNSIQVEAKEQKIRSRRQSLQIADTLLSERLLRKYSDQDQAEERSHLNSFYQKYRLRQKIGEGANAVVYTCQYLLTGKIYAVKVITMDQEHILELKRNFLSIRHLRHAYIVKYHALYFDMEKHAAYLIMEHFPFPNLIQLNIKDEQELKNIFGKLLEAVSYIHQRNICHRDLKPQNVLYDHATGRVKLIDFGISKKTYLRGQRRDMLTIIGTPLYLSPEALLGGGYDERADIWSLGVTLYKMVAGYTPFQSEYHSDTVNNIIKGVIEFEGQNWSNYSYFLKDLIMRMLRERNQRLTGKEALKHLWLLQREDIQKESRRRNSQFYRKLQRNQRTLDVRINTAFHEEQTYNLKHAISREDDDKTIVSHVSRRGKKTIMKKVYLIQNKQFDLQDSSEGESSPSTVHSREGTRTTEKRFI